MLARLSFQSPPLAPLSYVVTNGDDEDVLSRGSRDEDDDDAAAAANGMEVEPKTDAAHGTNANQGDVEMSSLDLGPPSTPTTTTTTSGFGAPRRARSASPRSSSVMASATAAAFTATTTTATTNSPRSLAPPAFRTDVQRSMRFSTTVPAHEVLRLVADRVAEMGLSSTLDEDSFRLSVVDPAAASTDDVLCTVQVYLSRQLSNVYIVEMSRGQGASIFEIKRIYASVRSGLSFIVRSDHIRV